MLTLVTSRAPEEVSGAQSIGRAVLLLREVGALEGASLSELATLTRLSKPTVRRILLALMDASLIEQDPVTRTYHLGVEAYVLGTLATRRFRVHTLALDGLARLAEISGDTAFLSVRRGYSTICLHREEGRFPIRTHVLKPGDRHPLGAGAAAIAILSALEPGEAEAVLQVNAAVLAERYPMLTLDIIRQLVANARKTGWGLNPGFVFTGSWGIAVPVRSPRGDVIAALTIAAIESRMQPERQPELGALLLEEAGRIETLFLKVDVGGTRAARPPTLSQPPRRT